MRVMFFVLLIANVALFAIAQLSFSSSPVQTRDEFNPDKLRLLAPAEKQPPDSISNSTR